ncbi:aminotransferase class I/II-fold pyridoxal phosphate-dependent enzyme [Oleidesulfovibrio sp.]|uniref:aminotransferase class I/II-fold pyridoxal phosphate-dependent enzyme n=1 Tax=Oleidesulfovibrio sp. TaxID=2909707 RepID=UPI003A88F828
MRFSPFRLERYFAQHEFSARHLLCVSDCESITVQELLDFCGADPQKLLSLRLGYTEAWGAPSLRRAIAENCYTQMEKETILVHAGAEEAIFTFAQATLEAGDHVIVQTPCYQSLFELPASLGCTIDAWHCNPDHGWAPDTSALRGLIKSNTKAIIINTPHNPTGYNLPRSSFNEVIKLADQFGLYLFCDEVYRGLEYNQTAKLPAACDVYPNAVSLGVTSKNMGLAGLRIGWAASQNRELLQRMSSVKDYTSICSSGPGEVLAEIAMGNAAKLNDRCRRIISDNLLSLDRFMDEHSDILEWTRPTAGPIGVVELKHDLTAGELCDKALRTCGVLLAPGSMFSISEPCFRIGFGRSNFTRGLKIFSSFLDTCYGK